MLADLELARIGWQFFVLGYSSNEQTASPEFVDSFAIRLSAQLLSFSGSERTVSF